MSVVKKPLKNKLYRSFLLVSLFLVMLTTVINAGGMFRLRFSMEKSNKELTNDIETISVDTAKRQITERLLELVSDKATIIDDSFFFINERMELLAIQARAVRSERSHTASYHPPRYEDNGMLSVQLLYPKALSSLTASEKRELGLLANISDTLKMTVSRSKVIQSAGVCFPSGAYFVADADSASRVSEDGSPRLFDARERFWYEMAQKTDKPFVLGPYPDVFTTQSCISYFVPVYTDDGQFGGVAYCDLDMHDIEAIVRRALPDDEGIACLLTDKGALAFSSAKTGTLRATETLFDLRETENPSLALVIRNAVAGGRELTELAFDDADYFASYAPIPTVGWALVVFYPKKAVFRLTDELLDEFAETSEQMSITAEKQLRRQMLLFVVFFVPVLYILFLVAKRLSFKLTHSITVLTEQIRQVKSDDLVFTWTEHTEDEVQLLAETFCHMTERLKQYVSDVVAATREKERMGTELSVATRIQANMLPAIFPLFPDRTEFEIFASMTPAKEVGGDFYDIFMVDKRHLAVVVADVSGKGVPAALFMVIGKTLIKDHTVPDADLGAVFAEVNDLLFSANGDGMFITAFEGVLDLYSGEFRYVNAGHEPPFVCHNGTFEQKSVDAGFVLAGLSGMKYKSGRIMLEPGDKFFQYTDGVTEATNAQDELYEMGRLASVLDKSAGKTPCEVIAAVKADVDAFVGPAPQFDDITMLCFEYKHRMEVGELMLSESLTVTAKVENLSRVQEFVTSVMEKGCASKEARNQIDIATEEVFINIASYAYPDDAVDAFVWVECTINCNDMTLTFKDKGVPYNPLEKKDPELGRPVEEMGVGGFGIFMTKQLSDAVEYEYTDGCNILRLKKKIA